MTNLFMDRLHTRNVGHRTWLLFATQEGHFGLPISVDLRHSAMVVWGSGLDKVLIRTKEVAKAASNALACVCLGVCLSDNRLFMCLCRILV